MSALDARGGRMPGFRAEGTREMSALWLGWSVGISSSVSMSVAGRITIWDDVDGRLLAVAQRAPGDTVGHNCSSAVVGGWSVKLWPTGGHSLFTQATATIGRRAEAGTLSSRKSAHRFMARSSLPALIVFDLDACLWSPEMFELSAAPASYDAGKGGMRAGSDVVRLFPGAQAVLRRILLEDTFQSTKIAVASSTTEPQYAKACLDGFPCALPEDSREERLSDLVDFRQIYPGNKGRQHFPALKKESGVPFDSMLFFDDCTYGDNCGDVARGCPGTTCVRTPRGLTMELFQAGLDAWASGKRGVVG